MASGVAFLPLIAMVVVTANLSNVVLLRPGQGGQRAGFSATAQISRGDFGIDRWTGGGAVAGDKVSISLRIVSSPA